MKYQATCNETEAINEKLKQTERELADIRKEANNYQNMLQQSQTQYATLERKYSKVKKMLRDFQQRDRDMVSWWMICEDLALENPFRCRSNSKSITYSTCKRKTLSTMR